MLKGIIFVSVIVIFEVSGVIFCMKSIRFSSCNMEGVIKTSISTAVDRVTQFYFMVGLARCSSEHALDSN